MSRIPARPYILTGGREIKAAGVHYAERHKSIGASIVRQHRDLFPIHGGRGGIVLPGNYHRNSLFQQGIAVRCLDFGDGIFVILQALDKDLAFSIFDSRNKPGSVLLVRNTARDIVNAGGFIQLSLHIIAVCLILHDELHLGEIPFAVGAISDFTIGSPACSGSKCTIKVSFAGNMHRQSLAPSVYPGGIDNLEELLDQGVGHTMRPVYGEWNGQKIRSRTTINGAYFIDAAMRDFLAGYGKEYNVTDINVEYEH